MFNSKPMKKLTLFLFLFLLTTGMATSKVYPEISVNGTVLTKQVKSITCHSAFLATLLYEDGSSEEIYAEGLKVLLSKPSGIRNTVIYGGITIEGNQAVIKGLTGKTPIYLYNANGQMVLSAKVSSPETRISLESLAPGIYFLKSGNTSVKFLKK